METGVVTGVGAAVTGGKVVSVGCGVGETGTGVGAAVTGGEGCGVGEIGIGVGAAVTGGKVDGVGCGVGDIGCGVGAAVTGDGVGGVVGEERLVSALQLHTDHTVQFMQSPSI